MGAADYWDALRRIYLDDEGLADRGLLWAGMWADVVVFYPAVVRNNATFAEPRRHPDGIPYVLVNGKVAVDGGKHTGLLNGSVLRRA